MKTIKKITTICVAVLLLTVNGYSQNTSVKALLDKPESRTEVFNTILGDHQLMTEFMTALKGNEHAMMMMNGNIPVMAKDGRVEMTPEQGDMQQEHQMMGHGNMMGMMKDNTEMMKNNPEMIQKMMGMMKDNPEMMQKMMGNMMDMCEQDSTMSHEMANMMTDHPEMMQMCMKKMNEKGMMGTDGKMKMMKSKDHKENSEHHRHQ